MLFPLKALVIYLEAYNVKEAYQEIIFIKKIKKSYKAKTCFHSNYDVHISDSILKIMLDIMTSKYHCILHISPS